MTRHATVRTRHANPALVAAALAPDNTDEMTTAVDGETVVTRIERDATGSLATTVDDYLTNLQVAARIIDEHHTHDTNHE